MPKCNRGFTLHKDFFPSNRQTACLCHINNIHLLQSSYQSGTQFLLFHEVIIINWKDESDFSYLKIAFCGKKICRCLSRYFKELPCFLLLCTQENNSVLFFQEIKLQGEVRYPALCRIMLTAEHSVSHK